MGVKQGEPLSPLLFLFFINDMQQHLDSDDVDSVTIDEIRIFMLLFADDTVLFSYTANGLQILLNNLYSYCTTWGISVNTEKTCVMVCKKGNRLENVELYYDAKTLNVVDKFTYLGVTLSRNGTFLQAQKHLSQTSFKGTFFSF